MAFTCRKALFAALVVAACAPTSRGGRPASEQPPSAAPRDPLRLPQGSSSAPVGEVTLRSGEIVDTAAGTAVPLARLAERLAGARVVFVGECPDHLAHRQWQARLVEGLVPGPGPLLVGLEMLERRTGIQTVLDAFSRGELEDRIFARQVSWYAQWDYDFRLYRPLFEVVRRRRLPLVALDAERALIRRVEEGGLAALSGAERAALPPLRLDVPGHKTLHRVLIDRVSATAGGQGPSDRAVAARTRPGGAEHLFASRVLGDEVMARTVLQRLGAAGPRARMLVITGNERLYYDTGVNARVRATRPDLGQVTVLLLPAPASGRRVSRALGDFLVGTPELAERALSLGLGLVDQVDGRPGVLVRRVLPGPARAAGIREGDVIVAVDGDGTSTVFALRWSMEQRTWGERPVFTVERGGERQDLVVHLKPGEEHPRQPPRVPPPRESQGS